MTDFQALIQTAEALRKEADLAANVAKSAMICALQRLMPHGTVLDLRDRRNTPPYAVLVKTMAGKDHGTRIFRIEKIRDVDFDPRRPELTRWIADATPISEKTGKDLNGSVAHSLNARGACVTLCGDLILEHGWDEAPGAMFERLIQMLESTGA